MTKSISAEELAESTVQLILAAPQIATPELKWKITQAIKTATEPLEAQNALLVNVLKGIEERMFPSPYITEVITKTTNAAQAAKERDERINADGFNAGIEAADDLALDMQEGFSFGVAIDAPAYREALEKLKKEVVNGL